MSSLSKAISGILTNKCPVCSNGEVFSGIYQMHSTCPHCQYRFEKEPGYFMGAVFAGYIIGFFTLIPTIVCGLFVYQLPMSQILVIGTMQIALLNPILFRFSKLIWLYMHSNTIG